MLYSRTYYLSILHAATALSNHYLEHWHFHEEDGIRSCWSEVFHYIIQFPNWSQVSTNNKGPGSKILLHVQRQKNWINIVNDCHKNLPFSTVYYYYFLEKDLSLAASKENTCFPKAVSPLFILTESGFTEMCLQTPSRNRRSAGSQGSNSQEVSKNANNFETGGSEVDGEDWKKN